MTLFAFINAFIISPQFIVFESYFFVQEHAPSPCIFKDEVIEMLSHVDSMLLFFLAYDYNFITFWTSLFKLFTFDASLATSSPITLLTAASYSSEVIKYLSNALLP